MNINLPPPHLKLEQDPQEFTKLLLLFLHYQPRRVLEIGSADGGTVWTWANNSSPGLEITAVSLFEAKEYTDPRPYFPAWEQECRCRITAVNGDSHAHETIDAMAKLGPYDWIFIDGDHKEPSVRTDYATALSMVAPKGIIVFHDVVWKDHPEIQVDRLWGELLKKGNTMQIISDPEHLGIGVLFT